MALGRQPTVDLFPPQGLGGEQRTAATPHRVQ